MLKLGELSLISNTVTFTVALPELGGVPLSVAMTTKTCSLWSSLSNMSLRVIVPVTESISNRPAGFESELIEYVKILLSLVASVSVAVTLITNDPDKVSSETSTV